MLERPNRPRVANRFGMVPAVFIVTACAFVAIAERADLRLKPPAFQAPTFTIAASF